MAKVIKMLNKIFHKKISEETLENYEGDIVNALLESSNYLSDKSKYRKLSIPRKEKIMFSFTVRPLNDDEWAKCRRQNLKNRGKRNETLDNARFASQVIYTATIDEDRAKLWDNQAVWNKLNVVSGIDVINAVLKPGEKTAIIEEINKICGYDDDLEEIIKNE